MISQILFNSIVAIYINISSCLCKLLAKHPLSHGKGELIKNTQHTRDRSKGIQAFINTVVSQFTDQNKAEQFINEIRKDHARYMRDQLQIMQYTITRYRSEIDEALDKCINDHLDSANDFRDIAKYLTNIKGGFRIQMKK